MVSSPRRPSWPLAAFSLAAFFSFKLVIPPGTTVLQPLLVRFSCFNNREAFAFFIFSGIVLSVGVDIPAFGADKKTSKRGLVVIVGLRPMLACQAQVSLRGFFSAVLRTIVRT